MLDGVDLASRNYGFTFELHAKFTYKRGTGQNFRFQGDDDVWVYINGRLVIDLGGLHSAENAEVNLDNLDLTDGMTYPLDFFFAERRVVASRLTINTSLELRPPDDPDPPVIPPAVKVLEGIYFDRNGDGIADSAEITLDSVPAKAPSLLELRLGGEVERGNWDILPLSGARFAIRSKGANFFTKPVTSWDETDPANRGRTLADASAGLSDATFPMKDGIGPVIVKAVKMVEDTTLAAAPTGVLIVTFSEPVSAGSPALLKFKDKTGTEQRVDMSRLEPADASGGAATTWRFILSPSTPNDPVEGWQVAIGEPGQVRDGKGIAAHPSNPWRPIESKLPDIHIGRLKAEKGVTVTPIPPGSPVVKPFVLLTSDKVTLTYKNYVPLRPGEAEEWIRRLDGGSNPGVVVFNLEISHPASLEISIFDHLGQFVNKTEAIVTREDLLQSGLLSRVPSTRAFLVRLAWYPQAHDGRLISTGAYILKVRYHYGIDARDNVAKGSRDQILTFGFVRPVEVKGMD
jgi:fibro-slime domain-containing protein